MIETFKLKAWDAGTYLMKYAQGFGKNENILLSIFNFSQINMEYSAKSSLFSETLVIFYLASLKNLSEPKGMHC